jgi:hypothetical protein
LRVVNLSVVFIFAIFQDMVRFKNRYLVIEANTVDAKNKAKLQLKPQALYQAIMEKIEILHGDFGAAAVRNGFLAKYCSEKTQVFQNYNQYPSKFNTFSS